MPGKVQDNNDMREQSGQVLRNSDPHITKWDLGVGEREAQSYFCCYSITSLSSLCYCCQKLCWTGFSVFTLSGVNQGVLT